MGIAAVKFNARLEGLSITRGRSALAALTAVAVAVLALPFLAIATQLLVPETEIWSHLIDTVLGRYLVNSLALCAGVMVGTLIIGVTTAWLCSVCEFPARRLFEWALILPLAYPAYITAYVYTGMLDYGGSVYSWLGTPLPIRSLEGAICVLTLVLYPYVYLLTRTAFMQQSNRIIEAGRTLGATPRICFLRIALPAARPAIIAGVSIVMMETLADYAAVKYFAVETFSVGILRTWFGLGSIAGATQLSILLLAFVVTLLIIEKRARRHTHLYSSSPSPATPNYRLHGTRAALAVIACALPLTFGFIVPTLQLLIWAGARLPKTNMDDYLVLMANSFSLALIAMLVILVLAILIAYSVRLRQSTAMKFAVQTVSSGYAVPGVVIGIGMLILFSKLDGWLGVTLSGSLAALVFAYTIRFLTLGFNPVETALGKISPNLDCAAHTLNTSTPETLVKIHLPLMRGSLLTAALLVFVEVIKELPATLVLRPFNFNTLAIKVYELAEDERLTDTAIPALIIISISILPLIVLARGIRRSETTP